MSEQSAADIIAAVKDLAWESFVDTDGYMSTRSLPNDEIARRALAALGAAGYAVVKLPTLPWSGVIADGRWVLDQSWYSDQRMSPATAREHAAALWAAAREADNA